MRLKNIITSILTASILFSVSGSGFNVSLTAKAAEDGPTEVKYEFESFDYGYGRYNVKDNTKNGPLSGDLEVDSVQSNAMLVFKDIDFTNLKSIDIYAGNVSTPTVTVLADVSEPEDKTFENEELRKYANPLSGGMQVGSGAIKVTESYATKEATRIELSTSWFTGVHTLAFKFTGGGWLGNYDYFVLNYDDTKGEEHLYTKGTYSNTYTELPEVAWGREWRDGMVSGNGEQGFVTSGSPYRDTLIYQYMWFNLPSKDPRVTPSELPTQLDDARQAAFNLDGTYKVRGSRTFYYSYHPGPQLRMTVENQDTVTGYERWTNYETAEVGVRYSDSYGQWIRTSFTSRPDNVSITKISQSSTGSKINMTLSYDDILNMYKAKTGYGINYKKIVDDNADYLGLVAHYPSYNGSELKDGGYAGITKVIVVNGTKEKILLEDSGEAINVGTEKNPAIKITDADAVYLVTKCGRTWTMGSFDEFADQTQYDLVDQLKNEVSAVCDKYSEGGFDYNSALAVQKEIQSKEFNAVSLNIDGDEAYKEAPNEALISLQQGTKDRVNHAFMERVYNQGRYAEICCGGSSAPRLYGMWTGEWSPGWRSIYTLDANVNLQISPVNTGHLTTAQPGYITFILRNAKDWEDNATMSYGMHDAIQPSVNSDGDRGMHVEYDYLFPFEYWNAGASWLLLPIYEYWQCYGNTQIEINDNMRLDDLKSVLSPVDEDLTDEELQAIKDKGYLDLESEILLPLLTKQANFWEQLCTPEYYMDANGKACYEEGKTELEKGEKYMLIPGYSPENFPISSVTGEVYITALAENAAMDIAAARDGLNMAKVIAEAVKYPGYEEQIEKWSKLQQLLPDYKTNEDGSLKEWAVDEILDNDQHRHLSHLYCAWPAYEAQNDPDIAKAAVKALENRNNYNTTDATAGHGWMHKALVEARLKNGDGVVESMLPMMNGTAYYTSLMTDHDSNRRNDTYCTDTSIGTIGAVNEAMVFSNTGEIEALPALPSDWESGSIQGIMARTMAEVEDISWNIPEKRISVTVRSLKDGNNIKLKSGEKAVSAVQDGEPVDIQDSAVNITLNKDESTTVVFTLAEKEEPTEQPTVDPTEAPTAKPGERITSIDNTTRTYGTGHWKSQPTINLINRNLTNNDAGKFYYNGTVGDYAGVELYGNQPIARIGIYFGNLDALNRAAGCELQGSVSGAIEYTEDRSYSSGTNDNSVGSNITSVSDDINWETLGVMPVSPSELKVGWNYFDIPQELVKNYKYIRYVRTEENTYNTVTEPDALDIVEIEFYAGEAQDELKINKFDVTDGNAEYDIFVPEKYEGENLYVALYSEDGTLKAVSTNKSGSFSNAADNDYINVFVWDKDKEQMPLSDKFSSKI